jgi:flagellar motor switch/type III secretory pathway protein FliN
MELSVGDLPIALGEVVKVGDKFGLRISKIIRPHERFESVGK